MAKSEKPKALPAKKDTTTFPLLDSIVGGEEVGHLISPEEVR